MEITTPYYHRYHMLVYIFKKICSEKATFEIFYEVWYENIYLLFLRHNQHPYQYQTHVIRLGSRRRYHLKKRSPQYLLSSQSYVLFSKSAMTFDLKNPRFLYLLYRFFVNVFYSALLKIVWERIWKCLTKICPHILLTWQFGPIWPHSDWQFPFHRTYRHIHRH